MSTLRTRCQHRIKLRASALTSFIAVVLVSLIPVLLAQDTTRSVWDGIYSKEQAARGGALYAKECAGCHGTSLTGGESAPPLAGGDFLSNWNSLTVGDLYERIRTTMPLSAPGSLGRQANSDILAFVLSANQFPPGEKELDRQTEALKQIRIEPKE